MTSSKETSLDVTAVLPRSRLYLLLVLYCAAFVIRLAVFLDTGYSADDALITFRYAENLEAGKGFVYNEGERVLGTTTPLFTLLLAILLKVGINCFVSSFVLNNFADLITSWIFIQMFRDVKGPLSWLPAALFLFSPESLQWSISGMETQIYISFLFLGFYFASTGSWSVAFFFAAITALTRIDGIALLGALLVVVTLRQGKLPAQPLAIFALTVLPWVLFTWFYFGSVLPNSAAAKIALSGENSFAASLEILLRGFLHLHTIGIPILALSLAGTWRIWKEQKAWLPLVIWTWGYALSYTLAAGPMHPWYYAPFYAGYLAIAFHGVVYLLNRFPRLHRPQIEAAFGIVAIIIILSLSYYKYRKIQTHDVQVNRINRGVGEWVRNNTPPTAVLAVKDIGHIGYYSQRKILDLAGLISPECVPFRVQGDFLGPIRKFHPDYFAFSSGQARTLKLMEDELMRSYELATQIQKGEGTYFIFRSVIK